MRNGFSTWQGHQSTCMGISKPMRPGRLHASQVKLPWAIILRATAAVNGVTNLGCCRWDFDMKLA